MGRGLAALLIGMAMVWGGGAAFAEVRPIRIERVAVTPEDSLTVELGGAVEQGRELFEKEYDNVRFAPVGFRFGLGDNFEFGSFLGFSANSDDEDGAPDDSGMEGITFFGKLAVNPEAALQVGVTLAGDDDVFPYANDGIDFFANIPLERPLGDGLLYGQFGYRVQGGDFDFNSYFNYGVGYGMPLTEKVGLNFELVGEESQRQKGIGNTLDLVAGANFSLMENLRLAPYLSLGFQDASPDVALGGIVEMRF